MANKITGRATTPEAIRAEVGDILEWCRVVDEDEFTTIYQLWIVAQNCIDRICGENYKEYSDLKANNNLARMCIKMLVNSMYVNRSYEVSSNSKVSSVVKGMLEILGNVIPEDDDDF